MNRACMDNGTCCHEYCVGGCVGPGPGDCYSCKGVSYQGRCLQKCPPDTYMVSSLLYKDTRSHIMSYISHVIYFTCHKFPSCMQPCYMLCDKTSLHFYMHLSEFSLILSYAMFFCLCSIFTFHFHCTLNMLQFSTLSTVLFHRS